MAQEAVAMREILALLPLAGGQRVLELALPFSERLPASLASLVTVLELPHSAFKAEDLVLPSDSTVSMFDVIVVNRVLTFASESQAKLVSKKLLRWLKPDGVVLIRESCLHEPFPVAPHPALQSEAQYRHPSFYVGLLGTACDTESPQQGFAYLDFVACTSLATYRTGVSHTHGELCFTYRKVEQPGDQEELNSRGRSASEQMDSFQVFLDNEQYSTASITRYEKIFGAGYVSTGGQSTTTEFVEKLNLQAGQRVLDVGCGIGGGDFYMANRFHVSVLGIDLSTNMVFQAMERFQTSHQPTEDRANDVAFEICDATTREFPDASFDVIYSRDTILHIEDKTALFTQFLRWLKPGGQLLISDYCCAEASERGQGSEQFQAYVKKRGYILLSPRGYGELLERVGFVDVVAEDRTEQFVEVLKEELRRTYGNKAEFVAETSQADFHDIVSGWESKLSRCADGDQKWGLFLARKA
ncbi:hypothetical protein BBJ28_00022127 [Nothophytophthora sp. Chile5]|nr:hypothetical protein BBJ28_00022127 [Nothophytophthora sp. Chile5]